MDQVEKISEGGFLLISDGTQLGGERIGFKGFGASAGFPDLIIHGSHPAEFGDPFDGLFTVFDSL